MKKSDQWKRAAVALRWIDATRPSLPQVDRDKRARMALTLLMDEPPWEYPWDEVIRSLRDRSTAQRDKSR